MLTGAADKAEWYDQYVDQDMSRDTNPLSLEQMRNALTYLDTQNNLRKANGQSALSVSLRMTAAAALNTSYSSNIWGHSNCYFDNGENLAGGGGAYTGGETEDTLGWPYTGLYTRRKRHSISTSNSMVTHLGAIDMIHTISTSTTTASTKSAGTISTSSMPARRLSVSRPVAVRTPIPR